jgi:hypothetical protein
MTFTVAEESVPRCPEELETIVYVLKIDLHRLMIKNCI